MKKIRILFKTGNEVCVAYSAKIFAELNDNLGKDHKAEFKNFTCNTKEIVAIFYEVEE